MTVFNAYFLLVDNYTVELYNQTIQLNYIMCGEINEKKTSTCPVIRNNALHFISITTTLAWL
ncbi:hypothetical protein JPSP3_11160 [Staphylococcus pseudintermedius]|nr:hypothetical protein GSP_20440 [Staphylococcus pseudintermedius]